MLNPLEIKELPKALPFHKILGPSFIILGLGLGSGEIILWPYLTSNFGMGIIWAAVLGLTFQFIMNMEIERYTLAHGESVFTGFARKQKLLPFWFLLSTFVPWVWPGIAASAAKILGYLFGIQETSYLAIGLLVFMGLILSLGPILYKTVENLQKTLILISVPSIFCLSIFLAKNAHWEALAQGLIGKGTDYWFLPAGIPIASFLAALAYAGAGGNLNLAQSFYIKEKGYGMGVYAGKITSLITGKKEQINLTGATFEPHPENVAEFKKWWKTINLEHFSVFWMTGSITIVLLSLLSYVTTYGLKGTDSSLNFVFLEAQAISGMLFPAFGVFFLLVAAATLFGTQLTVLDATSRILTENTLLAFQKLKPQKAPNIYYTLLWSQIFFGIGVMLFGFKEPLQLLIIAAVLNSFAMFVHVGLTLWLNHSLLAKAIRPSLGRTLGMLSAFVFYGGFSLYVIVDKIMFWIK